MDVVVKAPEFGNSASSYEEVIIVVILQVQYVKVTTNVHCDSNVIPEPSLLFWISQKWTDFNNCSTLKLEEILH